MAIVIPNDRPVYRILAEAGFFGPDDHLYPSGSIIALDDEPNEEMEPLNDLARKAQGAYFDKLDLNAKAVAEKAGRVFVARPRDLEDAIHMASLDARRVQLVQGDGGVPLMGAKKRGRKSVEAVVENAEAAEDGRRGRGGNGRLSLAG